MKRYIRAAETQDDFKIMLGQYKHRRDFNNADDTELADFLDELNNKGAAYDTYQHKTGGGCTVFYDDITGSSSCTVAAVSGDNWGRVKKLLEDEFDRGVPDPIFDAGAKVGQKVLPLMDAVQQDLGVDFDGQFNYGEGIVEFVTTGDDPELVVEGYDFRTFYHKLIGMIMEANSVRDFKQRYKKYLNELISDTPEYDASAEEQRHNENWRMMNEEHPGWAHRDFTTSSEGYDFIHLLRASDVPYDFLGDGKGGITVWYSADSDVSSATAVDSEPAPKGPAWIVRYNYDTGSRESGPYPEWNELLIYAPSKEMAEAKFEKDHLDDIPGHYDGCSVRKATKTEIRQWESAWAEDDEHQIRATQTPEYDLYQNKKNKNKYIEVKRSADGHSWKINAATASRMTDFQLENLFELADDMLYQVYDNYRYDNYTKEDIIQMVIEHVILVITEMDDDGVYEELLPFASTSNRQFMKNLKEYVGEMYDTLEWQY